MKYLVDIKGDRPFDKCFTDTDVFKNPPICITEVEPIKEEELDRLAAEVSTRTYKPTTSITFVVTKPKLREIFAANFRDRIAQHWVTLRLEPLLENRFVGQGNVSFNCRKGFGTQRAVFTLERKIKDTSKDYAEKCWIGRFDIRSFFMSIDVNVLWSLLEPFIKENYHERDLEQFLWLTKVIIFHQPQLDCERRGDLNLWNYLPSHKSLFGSKSHIGMPIGNITSQLLANFYLSFFDEYSNKECNRFGGEYIRFVDDFCIVVKSKEDIIHFARDADVFLKRELHLIMHPNKIYLQPISHGVKFVGSVLMPYRTYLANRTWSNFLIKLNETERLCQTIYKYGSTCSRLVRLQTLSEGLNSMLGFTLVNKSFQRREMYFKSAYWFWKICYLKGAYRIVKIKKRYKFNNYCHETYKQRESFESYKGRYKTDIQGSFRYRRKRKRI